MSEITKKWINESPSMSNPIDRLLSKVSKSPSGCWNYTGALDRCGYGKFKVGGRQLGAHKVSYILHNGDFPQDLGLVVMHSCDNPRCINPEHLSVGSVADNVHDCIKKGRFSAVGKNSLKRPKHKRFGEILMFLSSRALAKSNGDRFYWGSMCEKHDTHIRNASNGACAMCLIRAADNASGVKRKASVCRPM